MQKVSELIVKYRIVIVVLTVLLTAVSVYYAKNLKINPDILSYLPADDPDAKLFNEIGGKYGGNQMVLIGVESENVFDSQVLENVQMITDSIKKIDGVSSVNSITDIIDIKESEFGIEIGKLIDEDNLPTTKEELEALKNYTLSKDLYKNVIVSQDASLLLVYAKISEDFDENEVASQIITKVNDLHVKQKVHFAGLPVIFRQFNNIIVSDLLLIGPMAMLIILLILFISFRDAKGVFLPIITVIVSIIWTLGIMGFFNVEISIITNIIPVILLAIGSAYTVHVINRINQTFESDNKQRVIKALAYIIIPVILAAVTTMVGFVSFVFGSYLTMIKTFGLFTALGTFFALALSLTFTPALSVMFLNKHTKKGKDTTKQKDNFLNNRLSDVFRIINNNPKAVIITWICLVIVSLFGISKIERKSNLVEFLSQKNETRIAENLLSSKLGGTLPIYVKVKGDVQSPEVLKAMIRTADFMEASGFVVNTQSVADIIEEMNDIMGDDGKVIPDERDKITNLWFLIEGQEVLDQLISPDLDEGLVVGTFTSGETSDISAFIEKMNRFVDENKSEEYQLELTGFPSLFKKLDDSILQSQKKSTLIALLMVLLIVSLIFKSIKNGIFTIIPIIATLIILFGFMGFAGIPLNIATVLVGSISIGIGVDYSIHMISHYTNQIKLTGDFVHSVQDAVTISGRAITINVISVALGFLVLLLSNLIPLQHFGILVATTMVVSGLGAITLLPAIFIVANLKKKQ